jgi:hypothetical protein
VTEKKEPMEIAKSIARHSLTLTRTSAGTAGSASLVVLLTLVLCSALSANGNAQERAEALHSRKSSAELCLPRGAIQSFDAYERKERSFPPLCSGGNIREVIPDKYKRRYQKWKREFLASEIGREQWETYAHHGRLVLTITVSGDKGNGAITDKFQWDVSGNLTAATITLGQRLDKDHPNAANYPVLGSLTPLVESGAISWRILAAAKIAHEFGHVIQLSKVDVAQYRLQRKLVPIYNATLLTNGHNTRNPRLMELAREMGGTPVELTQESEYWAEANAMLYLRDRITNKNVLRSLFSEIKHTTEVYARGFKPFFNSHDRNSFSSSVRVTSMSADR